LHLQIYSGWLQVMFFTFFKTTLNIPEDSLYIRRTENAKRKRDGQWSTQKTKERAQRTPLKSGMNSDPENCQCTSAKSRFSKRNMIMS
jgi:hypothetical protein